ncbi:MAG: hypothetical protein HY736_16905 [Verrucomicrobia bacterium]|nr:hypothetical protein [Verrucomicrobiota bacterium]
MSQSIAIHTPGKAFRRFVARVWDDPESRSTLIGLLGVLLVHLLLWLVAPFVFRLDPVQGVIRPQARPQPFNIELAPETFAKQPPKPPPSKFVEANPDAPENTPDKTTNFAARNQQVAQEKPTPAGKSDMPALEGKKDMQSTQIVSGQLSKPVEHIEAQPPVDVPPSETVVAKPKAEQNPLPGFEKKEGENQNSFGSNIAKIPENARPIPNKIEGAKDVPLIEGATATQPAIDPKRPRARPQVVKQQQVRPAILAENKFGTTNIGNIAVDAQWSNYGAYLQRMIDTVQVQWERILIESKTYPPSGSTVTVKFILDDAGRIAKIVDVDNHSTDLASRACISGITDRAPYGPWTEDMKAVLGSQQEMTFTFYYQ